MLKAIIMFVFGNALWDKLVEFFGSTEAVVEAAIELVLLAIAIKFLKQIVWLAGFLVVAYIFWIFLH